MIYRTILRLELYYVLANPAQHLIPADAGSAVDDVDELLHVSWVGAEL